MVTQREAYYTLVNHFRNQAEFNSTLQGEETDKLPGVSVCVCVCVCAAATAVDVVALTGCARAALGVCASSSGAVAGLLTWQVS